MELDGAFERYSVGTGSGDVDIRVKAGAKEVRVGTGSGDVELDVTEVESMSALRVFTSTREIPDGILISSSASPPPPTFHTFLKFFSKELSRSTFTVFPKSINR